MQACRHAGCAGGVGSGASADGGGGAAACRHCRVLVARTWGSREWGVRGWWRGHCGMQACRWHAWWLGWGVRGWWGAGMQACRAGGVQEGVLGARGW